MRKITDDEFEYLFGFIDKKDWELLTPEQQVKCRESIELYFEKNTNIYEKYFELYDCTLQDLDTYYGFRHDAFIKCLVSSAINNNAVVMLNDSNQNYEEVKERSKERSRKQLKKDVPQKEESTSDPVLIFSEQQRIERFFLLTPLKPNDSDAVYLKRTDEELRSGGLFLKNAVTHFFRSLFRTKEATAIKNFNISDEKIMDTFSKLLKDEIGTYILVLQEPEGIRKKIYLM